MSTGKVSDPIRPPVRPDRGEQHEHDRSQLQGTERTGQLPLRAPTCRWAATTPCRGRAATSRARPRADGPVRASANDFPEYREGSWNYPEGYTNGDQRHKVRGWVNYALPLPEGLGRFDLGLIQRFDSGTGYDNTITMNPTPYVTNPGYITPTTSVTYYFRPRRIAARRHLADRPVAQLAASATRPGQGRGCSSAAW